MPSDAARFTALSRRLAELPAEGRTFSLFGDGTTTDGYYRAVAAVADAALAIIPSRPDLIAMVRHAGTSKRRLRRLAGPGGEDAVARILPVARAALAPYTGAVSGHLAQLTIAQRFSRTMTMSADQYHLAMLEIELMNQSHREAFQDAQTRLALLPHCLRDWSAECQAAHEEIDTVCRSCSAACWNNAVSALLRSRGVRPFIWMTADLPRLFRRILKRGGSLGVLGIACIPEVVHGMRLCERHGIPVVGLPLNGNRCARWMGTFHQNSINLRQLEKLLARM
jgi:hypothetical protein